MVAHACGFGLVGRRPQQAEIGERRIIVGAEAVLDDGAIGGGALRQDEVSHLDLGIETATGADADQRFGAIDVDQFMHVDGQRGLAHAGGLDGNRLALPGAGIAQAIAHRIDQSGIFEKRLGDPFGAQRVPRQQHGLGIVSGLGVVMGGHGSSSILSGWSKQCHPGGGTASARGNGERPRGTASAPPRFTSNPSG
jgi:hypothetical protein